MKQLCLRMLLLIGFVASGSSLAAIDTYEFADEQTRERFHHLNEELRCPKCQNQALGDSNSAIATDLRREVYRLLKEGKTDRQIKDFLVARYGEYILYRPELSSHTLMLWLAPLLMLLIGLVVVLVLVKRRRSVVQSTTLDVAEQENLKTLLEGSDTSSEAESNKRD